MSKKPYRSKYRGGQPSSKSVEFPDELSIEFVETYIEQIRHIHFQALTDLPEGSDQYKIIATILNEGFDQPLRGILTNTSLGVGYMLGHAISAMEMEALEKELGED